MTSKFAVDTNVFIYLHDKAYAQKLLDRYDFQLFDSIVVASALEAGCNTLYSEDLQHGLVVEKQLKIINPFI